MVGFLWATHREIAYDAPAQAVIDAYVDPSARFQDQLMAIEWLLCRTPQIGLPRIAQSPTQFVLHVAKGDALAKTNDVWLLYSYDDQKVIVHGVHIDGRDEDAS